MAIISTILQLERQAAGPANAVSLFHWSDQSLPPVGL